MDNYGKFRVVLTKGDEQNGVVPEVQTAFPLNGQFEPGDPNGFDLGVHTLGTIYVVDLYVRNDDKQDVTGLALDALRSKLGQS